MCAQRTVFACAQTRLEKEAEYLTSLEMTEEVEHRLSDVYER